MCGIAGFTLSSKSRSKFPTSKMAEALLLAVQERGEDATGVLAVANGRNKQPRIQYQRKDVKAEDFLKDFVVDRTAHTVLLHTRKESKGKSSEMANNHPVMWHTCYVTHNGHIDNDDELIKIGLEETEQRIGEVDSFAIPVTLDHHGWANDDDLKAALHQFKGGFAIAVADPVKRPGEVVLAKGEFSPLWTLTTSNGVFWASTRKALTDAWGSVMGTPPTATALKPGDFGFYMFGEGEYQRIITEGPKVTVQPGKFEITRALRNTNPQNYGATDYTNNYGNIHRPYTRYNHDWTCWPDPKNCVFQQDCGDCYSDDCECYDTNETHPVLNDDVTFKELHEKYATFRTHVNKFKLTEDLISRVVTCGVNPTREAAKTTGSSSPETASTPSKMPFISTALPGRTGIPIFTSCFFCKNTFAEAHMKKVGAYWKCNKCQDVDRDRRADGETGAGHSIALDPLIAREEEKMHSAMALLEAAAQETAMDLAVDEEFVKYTVFFAPAHKNALMREFQNECKTYFRSNLAFLQQVRDLEGGA